MKNVIHLDIDSERDEPIIIKKEVNLLQAAEGLDETLKMDLKHMTYASIYMASLLNVEDELTAIEEIIEVVMKRKFELIKNTKESSDGEEKLDS